MNEQCEVKQSELSRFYNAFARELNLTDENTSYIMEKLKSIHRYSEPENKEGSCISEKQETSLVVEINQQLRRLENYNSKLAFIVRHLNEII